MTHAQKTPHVQAFRRPSSILFAATPSIRTNNEQRADEGVHGPKEGDLTATSLMGALC
jgi:hypothetical protein